jgi:hypothetical protein
MRSVYLVRSCVFLDLSQLLPARESVFFFYYKLSHSQAGWAAAGLL